MNKQPRTIRILLAENQTIFRAGLRNLLSLEPDFEVVGEAIDGQAAVKLARELKPDLLLLDLSMSPPSAMDVLRQVAALPELFTIVLATAGEKTWIAEAFRLGARGAVLKDSAADVVVKSIRSVMKGMYWVDDGAAKDLVAAVRQIAEPVLKVSPPKTFGLTRRELEIVLAIVSGYSNREIAGNMSISEDTVKHHLTNIFDKVGVYNRLELALFAIHHGLNEKR